MKYWLSTLLLFLLSLFSSCHDEDKSVAPTAQLSKEQINVSNLPQIKDTNLVKLLLKKGNVVTETFPDSAIHLFKQAWLLSHQMKYNLGIASSLLNTGSCLFNSKKQYQQSRAYFLQAAPYCKLASNEDPNLMPRLYDCIANVYFVEGHYDSAVHYYYQSLHVITRSAVVDSQLLMHEYSNLASAMGNLGQYDRSLYYLRMAARGNLARKDTGQMIMNFSNMGNAYGRKGEMEAAISAFNQVLTLCRNQEKSQLKSSTVQNTYNRIATIWLIKNELGNAKKYLDSAVSIAPLQVHDNNELLQNLGCVYYFTGAFDKAIPYYKRSKEINQAFGKSINNLNVYATLAALYDTLGQGHTAYEYQKSYSALKDSLMDMDKVKMVNQLEVKFRTAEKDRELANKQLMITRQESKIRQQYLWIGVAVLSLLVLFGLMRRRKHKAIIAELKANLAGEEKERLRMASELHDGIVSKLSSVKMNFDVFSRTHAGDLEEAEEFKDVLFQLEQSIVELRTTAQNLQPDILQKAGLLAAIDIYCQKINKTNALEIHVSFLGKLPLLSDEFQLNIYRIIQELIQNILKHAHASKALVQLQVRQELLCITVEDNGLGMSVKMPSMQNGIGLTNLQNRIQLLSGTLAISNHKGTSIYMEFHLKQFIVR